MTNADNDILSREDHANFVSLYLNGSTDLTDILLSGNHSQHLRGTKYMSYLGKSNSETLQEKQGRNMVYGLRTQSPKFDWDQGSEERAQGSEEWDQGSQGF